jgi:1A family penicillin-binding protein
VDAQEGQPRPRRRSWTRRLALWVAVLAAAAGLYLDRQVVNGFGAGRCRDRVRFYGAPRVVAVGAELDREGIADELESLGYRRVEATPEDPGTYHRTSRRLEVFLRPAPRADAFADRSAELVRFDLDRGRVRSIEIASTGGHVEAIELDPPLLEGVLGEHWTTRARLALPDLPPHVVDAVLAAEDARFLSHPGVDFGSLMRAIRVNWEAREVRQGGSTLTQQIVKNHFLTQERTVSRKLREIPMALALEWHFSKHEILECYLATVYLGHDRLVGVYGFAEGAKVYFGKPASQLTLGEGATLAGMIRAPNALSPLRHPARAARRRDQVLAQLEELGWITRAQADRARSEPMARPDARQAAPEAYFIANVRRELEARGVAVDELASGAAVFTTLDRRLQRIVDDEVRAAVARLDTGPGRRRGAEVAVVALDPQSGAVRALAGGRDYLASQLDRATQIRRPVGSLFKPFVYLAAIADPSLGLTPASILRDEPLAHEAGLGGWSPRNSDRRFRGNVTVRQALESSLNPPAVRVAEQLGVDQVASFGESLALGRAGLPRVPAMALGAFSASLLDVAASFSVFPGAGEQITPYFVAEVEAPSGVSLVRSSREAKRIVGPESAYVVHAMLEGVFERGTARAVRAAGLDRPLAGKTGTTDDYRDAWLVGYTPSLLLAVWVGYDDDRPLPGGSSRVALPIWSAIMRRAMAGEPPERAPVPEGVELVKIDAATGLRAAPGCGRSVTEAFLRGTAPVTSCASNGVEPPHPPEGDSEPRPAGDLLADFLSALRAFF